MSSRGPVGASNRSELFSSRTGSALGGGAQVQVASKSDEFSPNAKQRELADTYGLGNPSHAEEKGYRDPLQLEHILGHAGDYRRTILCLPGNETLYVKR